MISKDQIFRLSSVSKKKRMTKEFVIFVFLIMIVVANTSIIFNPLDNTTFEIDTPIFTHGSLESWGLVFYSRMINHRSKKIIFIFSIKSLLPQQ